MSEKNTLSIDFSLESVLREHYSSRSGLNNCSRANSRATPETVCDCGADEANERIRLMWQALETYCPEIIEAQDVCT